MVPRLKPTGPSPKRRPPPSPASTEAPSGREASCWQVWRGAPRCSSASQNPGPWDPGCQGKPSSPLDLQAASRMMSPTLQSRKLRLRKQFSALTEVLFHFLTEPKEVERFLAQLSEFATTNQISLGPLRSIVKSLLLVPNGALKKSLTADQVRADFITLGLSEEKATYFSEKWKQNAPALARWAIGQTLMINQLIDMEWKFGVTSGSSELEKVGSIFLQGFSDPFLHFGEGHWLYLPSNQACWTDRKLRGS
ncbi:COMM domain-containing protein 7 isoform X4 [Vulpes vulpes]|uniref:COMM domain-containing protein 7 isoform X4 n=1 Tax=Vulpes vulpes TaxID=9627 RepID=A0ABM4YPK9_VULVU